MSEESETPPPMPRPVPPPPSLSPAPAPPPVDESLYAPKPSVAESGLTVATKGAEGDDGQRIAGAPAEINPRLLAGLIDVLVMVGLQILLTMVLPGMLDKIGWLAGVAYLLGRDSLPFLKSGSIGKTAMKLKVVKLDGTPMEADWKTAAVRNAALMIPFFGIVEAIVLMNRENSALKGRRLGDEWAQTKVVYAELPEEA